MTLVVVKLKGDRISAVADTLVTQADGSKPIDKSLIKIAILDDDRAVAFSGNPDFAREALLAYRRESLHSRVQVTNFFLNRHLASEGQTDFILMYGKPSQVLTVHDGRVAGMTPSKTCWSGEQAGFDRFQAYWHNQAAPRNGPSWEIPCIATDDPIEARAPAQLLRMLLALRSVIVERSTASIGGFVAGLSNAHGHFRYAKYALILDSNFTMVPAQSLLRVEVEEQQDYAQSCLVAIQDGQRRQAVAFHFAKGFLTYLFLDNDSGLCDDAQIIPDKTFAEFEDYTHQKYGFKWSAFIVDRRGVPTPGSRGSDPRYRPSGPEDRVRITQGPL